MKEYGNMSSTTIMFALADLLNNLTKKGNVFAAAFESSIAIEVGLMTKTSD